jgi:hypothetical protein
MAGEEYKPLLISTKRRAVFALCFACYLAAIGIRPLISHSHRDSYWLINYPFLPNWVAGVFNLVFYCFTAWILFTWCRRSRRTERVFFGVVLASFLVGFVKGLLALSAAAALQWAQEAGYVLMIAAAVSIYRNIQKAGAAAPAADSSQPA